MGASLSTYTHTHTHTHTTLREFRWEEVAAAYQISPASHGDFFWVFVSRTFYYMAVSCQIYIM